MAANLNAVLLGGRRNTSSNLIAIDGHTDFVFGAGVSTRASSALTTANAGDVIIALVIMNGPTAGAPSVTSLSGGGLTWTFRKRTHLTSASFDSAVEEWWAIAPSTLSAVTITATVGATVSFLGVYAFGISGANTSSPFDANASLPGVGGNTASSNPSITISTSNALSKDFVFAYFGNDVGGGPTAGSGFTQVSQTSSNLFEYETFSAPQSGLAVNATGSTTDWFGITDAVVSA